jgi:hypothetical protein
MIRKMLICAALIAPTLMWGAAGRKAGREGITLRNVRLGQVKAMTKLLIRPVDRKDNIQPADPVWVYYPEAMRDSKVRDQPVMFRAATVVSKTKSDSQVIYTIQYAKGGPLTVEAAPHVWTDERDTDVALGCMLDFVRKLQ